MGHFTQTKTPRHHNTTNATDLPQLQHVKTEPTHVSPASAVFFPSSTKENIMTTAPPISTTNRGAPPSLITTWNPSGKTALARLKPRQMSPASAVCFPLSTADYCITTAPPLTTINRGAPLSVSTTSTRNGQTAYTDGCHGSHCQFTSSGAT